MKKMEANEKSFISKKVFMILVNKLIDKLYIFEKDIP